MISPKMPPKSSLLADFIWINGDEKRDSLGTLEKAQDETLIFSYLRGYTYVLYLCL